MEDAGTTTTRKEVEDYYDQFKDHQKRLGLNIRHRTIYKNLAQLGLKKDSKVLEVGCGIGTVSHLILRHVTRGEFVGVDISEKSIVAAREFNSGSRNAKFVVSDMDDFNSATRFDFIVLPDVLEHIPRPLHAALFKVLGNVSAPDAVVLINIPEPNCLNWMRSRFPEKLQIIDQSLSLKELLDDCYPAGFSLFSVTPYGLQYDAPEYLSIVLKRNPALPEYTRLSWLTRFVRNLVSKL